MEVGQGTAQELVAEEESNCRNTPLSRSCIASVCLKQWNVTGLLIPASVTHFLKVIVVMLKVSPLKISPSPTDPHTSMASAETG